MVISRECEWSIFYIKIIKFTLCADASLAIDSSGPLELLIVIAWIVATH